ncbi:flagellar hook-associated protein 3 [candidate division KSB1 bacterium]|nr:MAG: flagellar hook-associated protein 3 [candidate division KSB1 bacterium]
MRVSNRMISETFINNVMKSLERLNDSQNRVLTGRKVDQLSDSPVDIKSIQRLNAELTDNQVYLDNIQNGIGWINSSSAALSQLNDLLTEAKNLTVEAANATRSATDRQRIAQQLNGILEQVLSLGNKTYLDSYIFAGTRVDEQPFVAQRDVTGKITSVDTSGDLSGKIWRKIAKTERIQINANIEEIFTGDEGVFNVLIDLRNALHNNDVATIQESLSNLTTLQDKVIAKEAEQGALMNQLEQMQNYLENENLQNEKTLSDIQDMDITEAIARFQQEQVAYQFGLAVGNQMLRLSLLNYLK